MSNRLEDIKLELGDKITFINGDIEYVANDEYSDIKCWNETLIEKIERYEPCFQRVEDVWVYKLKTIWERKEEPTNEDKEEKLLKIINHYGVIPQLKYFQSEVFELNEAILFYEHENFDIKHISEEIADVSVMLKQFQYYYGITDKQIEEVMNYKIDRQLTRMKKVIK